MDEDEGTLPYLPEEVSLRMAAMDFALRMLHDEPFDTSRLVRGASIICNYLKTGETPEKADDHDSELR